MDYHQHWRYSGGGLLDHGGGIHQLQQQSHSTSSCSSSSARGGHVDVSPYMVGEGLVIDNDKQHQQEHQQEQKQKQLLEVSDKLLYENGWSPNSLLLCMQEDSPTNTGELSEDNNNNYISINVNQSSIMTPRKTCIMMSSSTIDSNILGLNCSPSPIDELSKRKKGSVMKRDKHDSNTSNSNHKENNFVFPASSSPLTLPRSYFTSMVRSNLLEQQHVQTSSPPSSDLNQIRFKSNNNINNKTPQFVKNALKSIRNNFSSSGSSNSATNHHSNAIIDLISPSPVLVRRSLILGPSRGDDFEDISNNSSNNINRNSCKNSSSSSYSECENIRNRTLFSSQDDDNYARELSKITNSLRKQKISSDNRSSTLDVIDITDDDSDVINMLQSSTYDDKRRNKSSNSSSLNNNDNNSFTFKPDCSTLSSQQSKNITFASKQMSNVMSLNELNNENKPPSNVPLLSNNNNIHHNMNFGLDVQSIFTDKYKHICSNNVSNSSDLSSIMNSGNNNSISSSVLQSSVGERSVNSSGLATTNSQSIKDRIVAAANLDKPLPNGWSLFSHQKDAIVKCINNERSILAYDMGLGKTIIALIWAKSVYSVMSDSITIVFAPCTLIENWRREAESVGFECLELSDLKSLNKLSKYNPLAMSTTVTSYASSSNSSNVGLQKPILVALSWQSIPSINAFDAIQLVGDSKRSSRLLVIADEAHAMQSYSSLRTKAALSILLDSRCIGCVLSTGTPMKNGKPSNIYPLLAAVRHPIAKDKIDFERRYCAAKKTRFCAWDISGASNLEELKSETTACIIRKTKEECLDLPVISRKVLEIVPDLQSLVEYNELVETVKSTKKNSYHHNHHGNQAGGIGHGNNNNSNILEIMSKLRYIASVGKVAGTSQYIVDKLQLSNIQIKSSNSTSTAAVTSNSISSSSSGSSSSSSSSRDPIVVFVWFKETAIKLKETIIRLSSIDTPTNKAHINTLGFISRKSSSSSSSSSLTSKRPVTCEILTGDVDFQTRQTLVDSFQAGQLDVLVCTFGVGATGLTLTRSHTVVLLDRPWSPGDLLQAEDRIRRIGQMSKHIESIWIAAFDLDKKLDKMLQIKDKASQVVIADGSNRILFLGNSNSSSSNKGKSNQQQSSTKSSDIRTFFGYSEDDHDGDSNDVDVTSKAGQFAKTTTGSRGVGGENTKSSLKEVGGGGESELSIIREVFNSIIR